MIHGPVKMARYVRAHIAQVGFKRLGKRYFIGTFINDCEYDENMGSKHTYLEMGQRLIPAFICRPGYPCIYRGLTLRRACLAT